MLSNNLTTLEHLKDWIAPSDGLGTSSDILLTRLIGQVSRFILNYLQRPTLFRQVFSDVYDGVGQRAQVLRQFPVLSVSSFTVDGVNIPAAVDATGCGYSLDPWNGFPPGRPQMLSARGYFFCRGLGNIAVTYTAGFVVQGEAQTVPSTGTYSVRADSPNGLFGVDNGVTFANGTALAPQTSNAGLATGQYYCDPTQGIYYFAPADAGQAVLLTYSYVPADIEQACIEMVGERYSYKDRQGVVSKSLGGQETVSFSQKDMSDYVSGLLLPYRRVVQV